ncbi:putative disease resistance protein RGA1 [Carex rostrata]
MRLRIDAIDLFEYDLLKQKVKDDRKPLEQNCKNERGTRISLSSQFVRRPLKIASVNLKDSLSIFSRQKILLKGCINKLIEIAEEANEFRDLLEVQETASGTDPDRETISEPPISVFGREIDKENIVSLLTKKPSNSEPEASIRPAIPVIAITGRSGVGKTALAQYVYKHMDGQNHFYIPVWVHTSRKFKATDVIKNMIEIIKAKECASNDYPSTSLEALLIKIKSMLGSKKLLLVLDDFWSDTEDFVEQWEKFIGCLSGCSPGSRILLTTQSKNVNEKAYLPGVTEVKPYYLQEIEEDQFLELFMHYAWHRNSQLQKEEFEKIGRKIAVKLKGDPGAAKLVGQQLSGKNLRYWEEVAEKDWLGDNMKARIWSYQQLPHDLQRCFALCSLFRKGSTFQIMFLINIWMAEGFIRPRNKEERLEDIGENYLDELVSRFFIEKVEVGEEKRYRLHDLLHDLAEWVQGDDFIRIDSTNTREVYSNRSNIFRSENIHHILLPSSMINELKEKLCLMKNIRTFWVEYDGGIVPKNVLQEILKYLEKIRVLYLSDCVDDLPDSIGKLKHLRYLNIFGSQPLKKIPVSICKLYHLQTLDLINCESLPMEFCELISLRMFYASSETLSHISHVGRLTSLQELEHFVVRKNCGYELQQLENLNQLRGEMYIAGLENVGSTEDAVKANLRNKKHIKGLHFEWNFDERDTNNATCHSAPHVELLAALQPHPCISDLTLEGFGGDRFPNWLSSQNSLKYLRSLILMGCNKVEEIASIHESLPSCTTLILRRFKNLKKMPTFPPNLTSLEISNIPQVSYFSENDLLKKEERNQSKHEAVKQIVDCLEPEEVAFDLLLDEWQEILIFDPWNNDYSRDQLLDAWGKFMHCHMETMFYKNRESKLVLPSSLTYLEISSCSITDDALSTCIQSLVSLSKLKLLDIQTIMSLPPKEVLCSLKSLKSLTIEGCYLLSSLGGIEALTYLIRIKLRNCPNLNISDASLPSSLERLIFRYCSNADVIHAFNVSDVIRVLDVGNLSLLKELDLMGWYGLLEGLNSLTALRSLRVSICPAVNLFSSPTDKYEFALQDVLVDNLKLLKMILSKKTISSIVSLGIIGFQGDSSHDEIFQSLTSVKILCFFNCITTHLPKSLKDLASVNHMILVGSPTLTYPGILEGLPRNLSQLGIRGCPTLTEKFKKGDPNFQVQFNEGDTIVTFPRKERREMLSRRTH